MAQEIECDIIQRKTANPEAMQNSDATKSFTVPDPKVFVGLATMVFGVWLAFEGTMISSVGQCIIAIVLIICGWWVRKRGVMNSGKMNLRRWLSSCAFVVLGLFAAYVLGYFVLMDRHQPTHPVASAVRFESTLRWAPCEWITKAKPPYQTKWKSVTTWNILYEPMDRIWFRFFPGSQEEIEKLRNMGYYRN